MRKLNAISLLIFAAACGGGSKTNTPDASMTTIDAPASKVCTTPIALGAQDIAGDDVAGSSPSITWSAPVTTDLGDGGDATISFEFYKTATTTDLTKSIDLTMGDQNNYATCEACVRLETTDSSGNAVREYFQSGGTLKLTADPLTGEKMVGAITGLVMDEVTIDSSTYTSTPVANGKCIAVGDVTLNHDKVPNAYTCPKPTYDDGATCNCGACGVADGDCSDGSLPVAGCSDTTKPLCADDGLSCVARPACTVNATLGSPTLTTPTGTYDGTDMITEYTAGVNADAKPDQLDIQLYDGLGVFTAGVKPGTYQLTGDELDYNLCGACVQLWGDVDTTNGPTQLYMAKSGTLTLTAADATTLTGTLTNATFGAIKFDGNLNQVPDGSNCTSAITSASFTSPLTASFQSTKTNVRVHIHHGAKPAHPTHR